MIFKNILFFVPFMIAQTTMASPSLIGPFELEGGIVNQAHRYDPNSTFSPNGKYIAVSSTVWDLQSKRIVFNNHHSNRYDSSEIQGKFSLNSQWYIYENYLVRLADGKTFYPSADDYTSGETLGIDFRESDITTDNKYFIGFVPGTLRPTILIFDIDQNMKMVSKIQDFHFSGNDFAISPSGRYFTLVSNDLDAQRTKNLIIYDLANQKIVQSIKLGNQADGSFIGSPNFAADDKLYFVRWVQATAPMTVVVDIDRNPNEFRLYSPIALQTQIGVSATSADYRHFVSLDTSDHSKFFFYDIPNNRKIEMSLGEPSHVQFQMTSNGQFVHVFAFADRQNPTNPSINGIFEVSTGVQIIDFRNSDISGLFKLSPTGDFLLMSRTGFSRTLNRRVPNMIYELK